MENKPVDSYIDEFQIYLSQLDKSERDDVIEFYREYIIDAQLDTYDKIINKLGTPKHLARKILADYSIKMSEDDYRQIDNGSITVDQKMKRNAGMIGLIILALLASPFLVPVAVVLCGVVALFILAAIFFTLLFAFLIAASVVLAIALIVVGILVSLQSFTTTILYVGIGLAILGLDFILLPLIIAFCKFVFDALVAFFRWIGKKLLHGRDIPTKGEKEHA